MFIPLAKVESHMKKNTLAWLISSLLGSAAAFANANHDLTLVEIGNQTFERIEMLKQLADKGQDTYQRDGKTYINFQGHEYGVNFDNYPKFPFIFGEQDQAYRNVVDFVGPEWEFIWYNGGFYLIHKEFGVINPGGTGCYVEYIPAARGSKGPNGEYIWQSDMIQNIETSDCGDLSAPNINTLNVASVSDQGVQLKWAAQNTNDNVVLTLSESGSESVRYDKVQSGLFIGNLKPDTRYTAELSSCNAIDCIEPQKIEFTTNTARLGYADELQLENHLNGDLTGSIHFAQTHTTTAPNQNDVNQFPDLVIDREALLLFTPEDKTVQHVWVEVSFEGSVITRVPMLPPSALAASDQPDNGRSKVVFSHHAWSLPLQWDWMKPGLSLRLTDNNDRQGELAANELVFGGAPELIIQNIDMGMLTAPRNGNAMIKNMAKLSADYFQKIPASKLVMADYTAAYFPKVTLPNGKVYTTSSDDAGGWHGGDMREAIGKALVSTGVNNANVGITDSAGYSQAYNKRFNHITAHTNRGVYTNGIIDHGGSGGGGIVTLTDTTGNEWSHEMGHNYGLGHYPWHASTHDLESGWGWDALHRRFIGNLHWTGKAATNDVGGEVVPPFAGEFRFTRDAQAGGEAERLGTISRYTLEHPSQSRRVQTWLNNGFNIDLNSSTGYVRWNQENQSYEEAQTNAPVPTAVGVPVVTMLGIYDPHNELASQVYPLIYSNYGNVFDLPSVPDVTYHPEGWQAVSSLSDEQIQQDLWQTMKVNNQQARICQFTYTASNGESANFVGTVSADMARCESSEDMYWNINGKRERMISQDHSYSLLSKYGEGAVTYTPNTEIGEVPLCVLDKAGSSHDGAGYLTSSHCQQFSGVKHNNGADWRYAQHQGGMYQPSMISQRSCAVTVERQDGSVQNIAVANSRLNGSQSNKFHFNLEQQPLPTRVTLSCTDENGEQVLDSLIPDQNPAIDKLVGPIFVGQEHGYKQYIDEQVMFADNAALNRIDFGFVADFDKFVADNYGAGVLNNGETSAERRVGALYVYPNPVTGTHDYFLMRDISAADFPTNQADNEGWKYLGSAENHVQFGFNPLKIDRSNIDNAQRIASYFNQPQLLTWEQASSTTWGQSENAIFIDTDENGERRYFMQKRPGVNSALPAQNASDADWRFIGSDTDIEQYIAELNSDLAKFEAEILTWHKQDRMGVWGENNKTGTINDIYVYPFRGGYHYYRLIKSKYGYFPWPTQGSNPNNADWQYLGHF
ncbi:peptidase M66 [Vibrio parahaemolyticus]|nr:peptidase M66 [Vibrio parahaemolyticus]TOF76145.1 peptidase M66 [Vibrio parahaemolyticus]